MILYDLHGVRVLECTSEGPPLSADRDAGDLIGEAWAHQAELVAVPLMRLGDGFLDLRTRIAGEIIQKFVTYRLRLAIVGDISALIADSRALRDFVFESNQGNHVWFVTDLEELEARLEKG